MKPDAMSNLGAAAADCVELAPTPGELPVLDVPSALCDPRASRSARHAIAEAAMLEGPRRMIRLMGSSISTAVPVKFTSAWCTDISTPGHPRARS